ncbi:A1 cistron-splicing factor [Xylariaceae sp. FL0804]|nr:A1 cistron-splicing factor [Xylariaceae sp. FL0804]
MQPTSLSSGGDVFVLDDLPAGFTVGCDTASLTTSSSSPRPFRGFRDIPPGAHLVWVAPSESTSSRSAYWIWTPPPGKGKGKGKGGKGSNADAAAPGRVYVKRWDGFNEVLTSPPPAGQVVVAAGEQERLGQQQQQQQLFESLAPYDLEAAAAAAATTAAKAPGTTASSARRGDYNDEEEDDGGGGPLPAAIDGKTMWYQLTFAIRPGLLDRLVGEAAGGSGDSGGWPVTTTDRVAGETMLAGEARLYADSSGDGGGGSASKPSSSSFDHHPPIRFTFPMDAPLINPSAAGAERTRQALDPTGWILDKLEEGRDRDRGRDPGSSSAAAAAASKTDNEDTDNDNDNDNDNDDDEEDEDEDAYDLVGELQFAFLAGAHLGNLSCLEQWWFLAATVAFRAHGLATARPRLARALVTALHAQLVHGERGLDLGGGSGGGGGGGGLLEAMPDRARQLQRALTTYRARLVEAGLLADTATAAAAPSAAAGREKHGVDDDDKDDDDDDGRGPSEEQQAVGVAFASLEAWLSRRGWDLRGEYLRAGNVMLEDGEVVQAEMSDFEDEDERGEFAPVVVQMEEDGRETGLVSWDE